MKTFRRYLRSSAVLLALALSAVPGLAEEGSQPPPLRLAKLTQQSAEPGMPPALDRSHPAVKAAMAAQNRHTPALLTIPDAVGTATGLTDGGRPAILLYTRTAPAPGTVPESLDGIPVVVRATGPFFAMEAPANISAKARIRPSARFDRPVPIGVSTGNAGECSAGTIGARVRNGAIVFALSNNHVYALENHSQIGSSILQPGRYDTRCVFDANNVIGTLSDFEPIMFSESAANTIDAAIALSSTGNLGNATPSNGYGTPRSATAEAELGDAVQKYGRTSALTKGIIDGINFTGDITYDSGTARFVDQIVIRSSGKVFVKPGDSGSLVVTDPGRNPVGLLFAGSSSGKEAIANPIDAVLNRFGVTIDGD